MRIALLAPLVAPIAPPFLGGAQALLADLAAGLVARGHEVTLYAASGSQVTGVHLVTLDVAGYGLTPMRVSPSRTPELSLPPLQVTDEDNAGEFDPLVHDPTASPPAYAFLQVLDQIQRNANEHDLLHAHASDWPAYAYASAQPLPIIHTLHAPAVDPVILRTLMQLAPLKGRRHAQLVTVSHACAASYAPYCHIAAVIYNGIPLDRIPFVPQPDRATPYLLYAGRITPEKGVEDALDIAAQTGLQLAIAGGIYDQTYYEERILPRLEAAGPSVRYLGALSREALWQVMGESLAVLSPVLWEEPFGLVAAEANAAGTPVVAYARGGLPEVIVDGVTGRLIQPGNLNAAADAVAQVATFDRAACRAHIASRFSMDAMLDAYEAFYAETLAQTYTRREE